MEPTIRHARPRPDLRFERTVFWATLALGLVIFLASM